MKITKLISGKYTKGALLVITGLILGWLFFHNSHKEEPEQEASVKEASSTIWTCAMHPQIRLDHPGKCPICGMDLIPLTQNTVFINPDAVEMTEEGVKLAEVETSIVSRSKPVREVRLYGKIQDDERLVQTQPAYVPGRIEKLFVDFTGEEVRKGQVIAQIYSPDLITAQQELLEALKLQDMQPGVAEAAREKLRQWKLTDDQINSIEKNGKVKPVFDVYSNVSGIVTRKDVNAGDYVRQGAPLYEIADLSHVWALFDAYESDLPWIRKGDRVLFTTQSQPGRTFSGNISFIDPVMDPVKRVSHIRVEMMNPGNILKPEMFVTGEVDARLSIGGNNIIIPQSAVLWTGRRSVVYVKIPGAKEPSFVIREITTGPSTDNGYVVLSGLKEGEEIVTNGTFSVDASAELAGKKSMMNPEGGSGVKEVSQGTSGDNEVSMDFIMQMNTAYDRYIVLKNAFVSSDESKVEDAARELKAAFSKVNAGLPGKDHAAMWNNLSVKLDKELNLIINSGKLNDQRVQFSVFNDDFYKAVKMFGLEGRTVYYQFCPMMNDNKGAYWLSETSDIRNPYYGDAMLTCGETKDTLKY